MGRGCLQEKKTWERGARKNIWYRGVGGKGLRLRVACYKKNKIKKNPVYVVALLLPRMWTGFYG